MYEPSALAASSLFECEPPSETRARPARTCWSLNRWPRPLSAADADSKVFRLIASRKFSGRACVKVGTILLAHVETGMRYTRST